MVSAINLNNSNNNLKAQLKSAVTPIPSDRLREATPEITRAQVKAMKQALVPASVAGSLCYGLLSLAKVKSKLFPSLLAFSVVESGLFYTKFLNYNHQIVQKYTSK